jgi:hypothetical protein
MGLTFCRRKPHASTFGPCFDDHLVGAFDAPGANRPACLLIGRVLHVRFTLLQIAQFLLHGWTGTASYQPGQMFEHPVGSLVFEPVKHDLQTLGGQSASCCTYGLPNLIDVFGCPIWLLSLHFLPCFAKLPNGHYYFSSTLYILEERTGHENFLR